MRKMRIGLLGIAMLMFGLFLVACGGIATLPVKSIKITKWQEVVAVDSVNDYPWDDIDIKATRTNDKTFTFKYGNADGTITHSDLNPAVEGVQDVTITLTNGDGTFTDTIQITVTDEDLINGVKISSFNPSSALTQYATKQNAVQFALNDEKHQVGSIEVINDNIKDGFYAPYEVGDDNEYIIKPTVMYLRAGESQPHTAVRYAFDYEVKYNGTVLDEEGIETYFDNINNVTGAFDFSTDAIGKQFTITIKPSDVYGYISGFNKDNAKYSQTVTVRDGWNVYDLRDLQLINNVPSELAASGDGWYRDTLFSTGNGQTATLPITVNQLWGTYRNTQLNNHPAGRALKGEIAGVDVKQIKGFYLHKDITLYQATPEEASNNAEIFNLLPEAFVDTETLNRTEVRWMRDHVVPFAWTAFNSAAGSRNITLNGNYFKIDAKDLLSVDDKEAYATNKNPGVNSMLFGFNADRAPYRNKSDIETMADNVIIKNLAIESNADNGNSYVPHEDPANDPDNRNPLKTMGFLMANAANNFEIDRVSVDSFNNAYLLEACTPDQTRKEMKIKNSKVENMLSQGLLAWGAKVNLERVQFSNIAGPAFVAQEINFLGKTENNNSLVAGNEFVYDTEEKLMENATRIIVDEWTVNALEECKVYTQGVWFAQNPSTQGMVPMLMVILDYLEAEVAKGVEGYKMVGGEENGEYIGVDYFVMSTEGGDSGDRVMLDAIAHMFDEDAPQRDIVDALRPIVGSKMTPKDNNDNYLMYNEVEFGDRVDLYGDNEMVQLMNILGRMNNAEGYIMMVGRDGTIHSSMPAETPLGYEMMLGGRLLSGMTDAELKAFIMACLVAAAEMGDPTAMDKIPAVVGMSTDGTMSAELLEQAKTALSGLLTVSGNPMAETLSAVGMVPLQMMEMIAPALSGVKVMSPDIANVDFLADYWDDLTHENASGTRYTNIFLSMPGMMTANVILRLFPNEQA